MTPAPKAMSHGSNAATAGALYALAGRSAAMAACAPRRLTATAAAAGRTDFITAPLLEPAAPSVIGGLRALDSRRISWGQCAKQHEKGLANMPGICCLIRRFRRECCALCRNVVF